MRLSVATNFDPLLIDAVRGYPVVELFGKLREDAVGGGRAPYQLAPVTRKALAEHVRLDAAFRERALRAFDELFRALDGGMSWRYLPKDGPG